jgi:predicted ATPase
MLTGLRLGNFKAFADTQYIPIRPLTLIFGANSAGKSSLIHSLLLACHASETGELDIHRTRVGGDSVDLGGFRQYIHRRDYGRSVEYSVEMDVSHLRGRLAELLAPGRRVTVTVTIGIQLDDKGQPKATAVPEVQTYEILVDGGSLLRMSRRPDGTLQLDRLEQQHPVLQIVIKAILETVTTVQSIQSSDLEGLNTAISEFVPHITAVVDGIFPRQLVRFGLRDQSGARKFEPKRVIQSELFEDSVSDTPDAPEEPMLFPVSQGRREEDLAAAIRFFLPRTIDELIRGLREALVNQLARLHYLGPLRSYPPRHIAFTQHYDLNWFAGGGYAWDEVRKNKVVRDEVNAWLQNTNQLQARYELVVRELIPLSELEAAVADSLEEMIDEDRLIPDPLSKRLRITLHDENKEKITEGHLMGAMINVEAEARKLTSKLRDEAPRKAIHDLVLMDRNSRTIVSHRDVGIGISQVLPVLVTAFASRNKFIAMEQPEIHLHPALQAELGDVFIESALGERKNTMILETHSEHLILRIMRRMRETAQNKLGDNMIPVKPSDVAILYVKPDSSGAKVLELRLDNEGTLLDPWPGGFFEEGFRERFA